MKKLKKVEKTGIISTKFLLRCTLSLILGCGLYESYGALCASNLASFKKASLVRKLDIQRQRRSFLSNALEARPPLAKKYNEGTAILYRTASQKRLHKNNSKTNTHQKKHLINYWKHTKFIKEDTQSQQAYNTIMKSTESHESIKMTSLGLTGGDDIFLACRKGDLPRVR